MNKGSSIISAGGDAAAWDDDAEDGLAASATELRELSFAAADHGQRLDRVLAARVTEFSRSYLAQLIEAGAVRIDGQPALRPSHKVRAGQRGQIELRPTPQSQAFLPDDIPLTTVYEDDHLRVIDKPAGLVVHPAAGHWRGTLLNGLLACDPLARQLPRAGIVHRLDKDTSGLMVIARSRRAMDALVAAIASREVSRQYIALVHRPWAGPRERTVDAPIGRDPRHRLRMAVVDLSQHAGKPARTDFTLIGNAQAGALVHCRLHTGRTHQIRVHLASLGHPLVGDGVYGGSPAAGLQRQGLHAARLAFAHPATGDPLTFESAPPDDLAGALRAWALGYNALPG